MALSKNQDKYKENSSYLFFSGVINCFIKIAHYTNKNYLNKTIRTN